MALTECKECGHQVSDKADACHHCGARQPKRTSMFTWIVGAILGIPMLITIFAMSSRVHRSETTEASTVASGGAGPRCSVDAINIKSVKFGFVDECRRSACPVMRGVAIITNGCAEAVGVEIKITGLDASGAPVSTRELWPASVRNIPPGDYTISLDQYLPYDGRIKSITLAPIRVKQWQER